MSSKNTLRTLKDLDFNDWISIPADKFNEFIQNKIKFEAVKWVKEDIEEHINTFRDILNGRKINSPQMTLIKRWMKRLDIKEEDLK